MKSLGGTLTYFSICLNRSKICVKSKIKKNKNLKLRKNYFLLVSDNVDSALSDETVQEQLRALLPELAFIRLRSDHQEETFIVEDEDLMVAISEFFKTLEEYKSQ